jgi:type IV pilus assembly protein PilV
MTRFAPRTRRAMRGFTLVEVLVALLLFSFGILGAVATEARILQATAQNEDRSRASLLANEIIARMWAERSVSVDATAWQLRVADPAVSGLPNGAGSVSKPDADGMVTITVTWRPPSMAATSPPNRFVTTASIS